VSIYGGYAGQGAADPDARDVSLYLTILSGDIGVAGNKADNSYHVVTAMWVGAATSLDGVTVTGGNANGSGSLQLYGGGILVFHSSPTLVNCIFSGNSAGGNSVHSGGGGGMSSLSSSPTLINCIFSGNSANYGGGTYSSFSSPTLTNCTFSGNSASIGGGMYSEFSSPILTNCILWGNVASSSPQIRQSGGVATVTYSNIQGGHAGTGNINADPLFVRNPSRGPDNVWGTADDDYGDLRLRPESPCVDRGNNNAVGLAGITTDLAGRPRFVDIALTPDAGLGTPPIIDMGAYEVQWRAPTWLDPAGLATWDFDAYCLDIGHQTLVVAADDGNRDERLAEVREFISAGRSGGAGIVSSAAGEDQWVMVTLDEGGNILVRLALKGDVTLDDRLDGDDYFEMDRAFLFAGGGLAPAADLNLDGAIDGRDYFLLDLHFLRGVGAITVSAGAVPQWSAAGAGDVFCGRRIAEELLVEDEAVLVAA
jgi:hypothetical protein